MKNWFYPLLLLLFLFPTTSYARNDLDLELLYLKEKSSYYLEQVDLALEQERTDLVGSEKVESSVIIDGLTPVYFSQLDERWCFQPYGTGTPGILYHTGCGPTALAMVVSSLKEYVTPDLIAAYGMEHGYNMGNNGSSWALFPAVARKYQIHCQQTVDPKKAIACLEKGGLVIASQNNGLDNYWTTSGHFIVLTGFYGEYFTVHDPSSKEKTEKVHTFEEVFLPNKQLFLFYL